MPPLRPSLPAKSGLRPGYRFALHGLIHKKPGLNVRRSSNGPSRKTGNDSPSGDQ